MSPGQSVARWICPWVMRSTFNGWRVGEEGGRPVRQVRVVQDDPAPRGARQPRRTRSQRVLYVGADGQPFADCHRYLLPGGKIGGSGKPDPKWLLVDGENWSVCHDDEQWCDDCPEDHRQGAYIGRC